MRVLRNACLIACAALALSAVPCPAADEPFSFYGLQFGTPRAEIARRSPLAGNLVKNPGHGMSDLELVFDREELLMEIRASWPRPEDQFQYQGLQRALREKFIAVVAAKYPTVAVTPDEYSNRAAVRLVFLSTALREKNIDYHRDLFLKTLQ